MTITMNAFLMGRAGRAAALAAAAMLALAGCAGEQVEAEETTVPVSTTEAPTATPMFASDEEALASGLEASQAAADLEVELVGKPGDQRPRFEEVASGDFLEDLLVAHEEAIAEALTYQGRYSFSDARVQRFEDAGDQASITFYVCVDPRGVNRLVEGQDPTPAGSRLVEFDVTVVWDSSGRHVSRNERWVPNGCD